MKATTQVAEPRFGGDRRIAIPCDCVSTCSILLVVEWDGSDDYPSSTSLDFYTQHNESTWRDRLRAAWRTIRGKGGYYHGIVTTPEQAAELGYWLLDKCDTAADALERMVSAHDRRSPDAPSRPTLNEEQALAAAREVLDLLGRGERS